MNLQSQLTALQEQGRGLATSQRASLCCRLAKQLEKAGEYEAACEALSEFWPEGQASPRLEGLDQAAAGELLLRVGALAGWLGSAEQAGGNQENAKNLITRSVEIFEALGESQFLAEARSDLALCYWREGSYDEARDTLVGVIQEVRGSDNEMLVKALLRTAIVEKTAGRFVAALEIYREAAMIIEQGNAHPYRGELHNGLGTLLNCLGHAEGREDY